MSCLFQRESFEWQTHTEVFIISHLIEMTVCIIVIWTLLRSDWLSCLYVLHVSSLLSTNKLLIFILFLHLSSIFFAKFTTFLCHESGRGISLFFVSTMLCDVARNRRNTNQSSDAAFRKLVNTSVEVMLMASARSRASQKKRPQHRNVNNDQNAPSVLSCNCVRRLVFCENKIIMEVMTNGVWAGWIRFAQILIGINQPCVCRWYLACVQVIRRYTCYKLSRPHTSFLLFFRCRRSASLHFTFTLMWVLHRLQQST